LAAARKVGKEMHSNRNASANVSCFMSDLLFNLIISISGVGREA
jgi:hypothetical protein